MSERVMLDHQMAQNCSIRSSTVPRKGVLFATKLIDITVLHKMSNYDITKVTNRRLSFSLCKTVIYLLLVLIEGVQRTTSYV